MAKTTQNSIEPIYGKLISSNILCPSCGKWLFIFNNADDADLVCYTEECFYENKKFELPKIQLKLK